MEWVKVRRNVVCGGCDGTNGKIGTVVAVQTVIFRHRFDASAVGDGKRMVFVRCVEVSSVCDRISLDITTRLQRGVAVPLPDGPQSGGGYDGCVVRFYDPRFVLSHANRGIVTHPAPVNRAIHVYRETTGGRVVAGESEKDCFDSRPSMIVTWV